MCTGCRELKLQQAGTRGRGRGLRDALRKAGMRGRGLVESARGRSQQAGGRGRGRGLLGSPPVEPGPSIVRGGRGRGRRGRNTGGQQREGAGESQPAQVAPQVHML